MKHIIFLGLCLSLLLLAGCKTDKPTKASQETSTGDNALDQINALLEQNNIDPKLRYERAKILFEKKMYDETIEDLRVAITLDSMQPDYYHLLSDAFMDNALSSKSLQTMKVAAKLFPERIPTLLKLSETHYILTQFEEALGVLNEIIRLDPTNAEAYFMVGLNFRDMGDIKRATNALQTATEFDSKLIDAWIALSELYEKVDINKSFSYLETALRIDPKNTFTKHSLAYLYQNNDKIPDAIQLYKDIIIEDQYYKDAYLNLGILYIEMDSLSQASEQFTILVNQSPTDARAHYYHGLTKYLRGDNEGASIDIQNALNLNPEYEKAIELLNAIKSKGK